MANPCPSVGLLFGFLATVGIVYTLASKQWKVNSQVSSSNVNMGIHSYEGLWVRCTSSLPGQQLCDTYDESILALPAELQAQRALMVLALIFAVGGLAAGAIGLECIHVMSESKQKTMTGRTGGALMFLAGVCTLVAVSWYAAVVVWEFQVSGVYAKNPSAYQNTAFAYEFGPALYVGWITSGIALILASCCYVALLDTRMMRVILHQHTLTRDLSHHPTTLNMSEQTTN